MLRIVAMAIGVALLVYLVARTLRELQGLRIDWTGIAMACGFIALAFYLRHAAGWG